jgi:hypothetical protein
MTTRYTSRRYRSLGLCMLIVLLAACSRPADVSRLGETPAPTATPSEALRRDAQEYARQFGVSEDEALQRLGYQDDIGELQNALQTNEADTFGGLWIEHEPTYRIVVLFTRAGDRTIRPYLAGRAFADLVEVRQARYTWAELQTAQTQTLRELEKLDFGVACFLNVQENRVEIPVGDRAWVESELRRVGAQLPEGVELVVTENGSTARDKDLLLTPPVPGIAFPRQKPTEGIRTSMLAQLIGTLWLDAESGCLRIRSLYDNRELLPIWPPEFTLQANEDRLQVIDGQGESAVDVGQEVYMGGGYVPVTDEWVLQQIPDACRGEYFVVGNEVRPNVPEDAELLNTDVLSTTEGLVLFPRYTPALDQQVTDSQLLSGKLVSYPAYRCLHLQTESWGPMTLAWPTDWSVEVRESTTVVLDAEGVLVAHLGDEVTARVRSVPHSADVPVYRQLIDELPGDCIGATWLVDGIEPVE